MVLMALDGFLLVFVFSTASVTGDDMVCLERRNNILRAEAPLGFLFERVLHYLVSEWIRNRGNWDSPRTRQTCTGSRCLSLGRRLIDFPAFCSAMRKS
jgi:hypothetical protein